MAQPNKLGASASSTSSYASDPFLQPFLADDFDPVDYFNSILPTWSPPSSTAQKPQQQSRSNDQTSGREASLAEIAEQTQAHVTKLNTQLSTLSNTLTQLVDDILRSGSRLGYEVEVLRSDTATLQDVIHENLRDDFAKFVPSSKSLEPGTRDLGIEAASEPTEPITDPSAKDSSEEVDATGSTATPEYITRLRTLCKVRERLDAVVQTFGAAIDWPMAPSEIEAANGSSSAKSSAFISITPPDPVTNSSGISDEEKRRLEIKGKECTEKLRAEIETLVGDGTDIDGLNAAQHRVDELAELTQVWKGTIEEKARVKFVESLARLVDERKLG